MTSTNLISPVGTILREIDNRIAIKKANQMKKDLETMNKEMSYYDFQIRSVNKTFSSVLLKDKPVGNSIKAVRYIKNERNHYR